MNIGINDLRGKSITRLYPILALAVLSVVVSVGVAAFGPSQTSEGYNTRNCPNGEPLRWHSSVTSYDRSHGNFPQWWQTEIDEAADIWNDDGGANFSFYHYTGSGHDWTSKRLRKIHRIAETAPDLNSSCQLTDVDTAFNSRYTFNRCDTDPGDCNQSDVYDVKAVSLHEFGHWFILEHTQWWRFGCVMRGSEWEDRTLCGDDRNGFQFIYGTD